MISWLKMVGSELPIPCYWQEMIGTSALLRLPDARLATLMRPGEWIPILWRVFSFQERPVGCEKRATPMRVELDRKRVRQSRQ